MAVTVEKGSMGEPALLLERSRAITLHGRDRKGRAVVRIVGNYFPGSTPYQRFRICPDRRRASPCRGGTDGRCLRLVCSARAGRPGGGGAAVVPAGAHPPGDRGPRVRGRVHALPRGSRPQLPRRRCDPRRVRDAAGRGQGEAARRLLRAPGPPVQDLLRHLRALPLQLRVR